MTSLDHFPSDPLFKLRFPGDPRFSSWIFPNSEDIRALSRKAFLSTVLLDSILQRAAPPPDPSSPNFSHIGSLHTCLFMKNANALLDQTSPSANKNTKQTRRIQKLMSNIFEHQPDSVKRLLIPIVESSHFFVLCLDVSFSAPHFIVGARYFDSMQRRTRQVNGASVAARIMSDVNQFFCNFVLHKRVHHQLREPDEEVLKRVEFSACPAQTNGYDCGLFAVAVVLHLVDKLEVDSETFSQRHITEMRSKLWDTLRIDELTHRDYTRSISEIVRNCFPKLQGTSIVETFGVEVLAPGSTGATAAKLVTDAASVLATIKDEEEPLVITAFDVVLGPADFDGSYYDTHAGNDEMEDSSGDDEEEDIDGGHRQNGDDTLKGKETSAGKAKGLANDRHDTAKGRASDVDVASTGRAKGRASYVDAASTGRGKGRASERLDDEDYEGMDGGDDYKHDDDEEFDGRHDEDDDEEELDEDDDEEDMDGHDQANNDSAARGKKKKMVVGQSGTSLSGNSIDSVLCSVMRDANVDCFATLDDVTPIIEAYEVRSGNSLAIRRSMSDRYRLFQCREHHKCGFQILFSKRRSDGMFCVSRVRAEHSDTRRAALAADGRKWKKRRHAKLDDVIGQVVRTKHEKPTAADVVKSAATHSGMIVPYMTAYRALCGEMQAQGRGSIKNFESIIPYLEALKKSNPGSVMGYTRDNDMQLLDLFFFPGFMNESLKCVRPVVSLDAAHMKGVHKGTLYLASVLTGANDVYPIGFMISCGNEDRNNWRKMLTALKQACPIISDQGGTLHDTEGVVKRPFLFISDRDKGLKPALHEVFPNHYEMSCAKHIEGNVAQKYGKECARYVVAIAKAFSTRRANDLLEIVRSKKAAAAVYLEEITNGGTLWQSTQWFQCDGPMVPPRYGIVTSNTSESANNMFAEARNVGWCEAVEKLLDVMSTRICTCRMKYNGKDDKEVVPKVKQILKKRWDSAATMTVAEIELGCGDFKVVEPPSTDEDDIFERHAFSGSGRAHESSVNIVKPELEWCSCGKWQDFMFPCRHGCAVYRKWMEKEFDYVLEQLVHPYYKYDYVKRTFKSNVFPVSLDTIQYDGVTKPPRVSKRQPGRPRIKRHRRRSEFLEPEDSPVTCSICGKRGHNRRSCRMIL